MAILDIEYGRKILEDQKSKHPTSQKSQNPRELEMVLHNSSFGHQYAMLELESTNDSIQQQALLEKMEAYRKVYFAARLSLEQRDPHRLQRVETSIQDQKVRIFGVYRA
jgi:hypothetical protein